MVYIALKITALICVLRRFKKKLIDLSYFLKKTKITPITTPKSKDIDSWNYIFSLAKLT